MAVPGALLGCRTTVGYPPAPPPPAKGGTTGPLTFNVIQKCKKNNNTFQNFQKFTFSVFQKTQKNARSMHCILVISDSLVLDSIWGGVEYRTMGVLPIIRGGST